MSIRAAILDLAGATQDPGLLLLSGLCLQQLQVVFIASTNYTPAPATRIRFVPHAHTPKRK